MKYYSQQKRSKTHLRPPDLYEYFVDNYWFTTGDLDNLKVNEALRGSQKADIVIIGGGYTGLSAGYNLRKKFPNKRIVLLEGACCGYGASGRNGGFCISTDLLDGMENLDEEARQKAIEFSFYGLEQIKQVSAEYGFDCELEETGLLEVALTDKHIKDVKAYYDYFQSVGLNATYLEEEEVRAEINSPVFKSGVEIPYGAILNPAKLAQGMKMVNEQLGVEIFEKTVVTRVTPGKTCLVETELGEIQAPVIVLATNAYGHKLGFFKARVIPISVFQIATEPLSDTQWESIGWKNRQGLSDMRALYNYCRPTVDGRIVMGGASPQYYRNDALTSGNDRFVTKELEKELTYFFPQLEGLKIEHAWGGTTALTLGRKPSVGVLGDHRNVYYAVGYGEGVPTSQTGGRMIAELIAGEDNEFTRHALVDHKIPWAGPTSLRWYFAAASKWLMNRYDLPLYR